MVVYPCHIFMKEMIAESKQDLRDLKSLKSSGPDSDMDKVVNQVMSDLEEFNKLRRVGCDIK